MSPRIADLGDMPALTAGFAPFQPGPTSPPPTGPGTGDGSRPGGPCVTDPGLHRWAPAADRPTLTALHTAIAQDPPVGPLLADLNRAVAHSREVRS